MNQGVTTKQRGVSQSCQTSARNIFLYCGRLGLRRVLIIISSFNLAWALYAMYFFWSIEETPLPPLLGYSWNTQIRATLLPEACVSGGMSAYLIYGSVKKRTPAILVAILCQWVLVMGSFVFGFLYLLNIAFTPRYFQIFVWLYFSARVYILVLSMQYFYILIGGDPWKRFEEDVVRTEFTVA